MRPRARRITKPRVFALLMGLAVLLALLPTNWTRWPGGILQPLGWLQWSASSATRVVGNSVRGVRDEWLSPGQAQELRDELDELRRQLWHQTILLADLEHQTAELTGIRAQLGQEQTRIVIAAVIGFDASPRRQTLMINKGRLSEGQIRVGQWVAAGLGPDREDRQATGRELLLRQWLIGKVSKVDPYRSWVQLATDPDFGPEPVRVAGLLDGQWQRTGDECLLYGLGSGRMLIRHAKGDYWASGHTLVLVPRSGDLPASLSVGRISSSRTVSESSLWHDLDVRPWADPYELTHVYVISAGS
jgi:cell shape-determining protein MreC